MNGRGPVAVFVATSVTLAAYLFPYFYLPGTWWRAIPSAVAILLVGAAYFGREMPTVYGLAMSWKELAISTLLCAGLLPSFSWALSAWVIAAPLTAVPYDYPPAHVHQFFQVFNDEIVLRAALLTIFLSVVQRPWAAIVLPALAFAIAHHLVYRPSGVEIAWPAMVSIFAFATIANALFVRFRHIGYGFALHYAWNFDRFNSAYYLDGAPLSEGATFNYIEGSSLVVVGSVAAMLVTVGSLKRPEK